MSTVLPSRSIGTGSNLQSELPGSSGLGATMSPVRIIGILSIILLAGTSAFGQFIIQPMKVEMSVHAGRRVTTKVALENLTRLNAEVIDLRIVDMTQDPNGIWQAIEPDEEIVEDPNGARWVTINEPLNPMTLDISKLRSCRSWLRLESDSVELEPLQRKELGLQVTVPPGRVGYYCAALIAQTRSRPGETGVRASVILQFVVPVIIQVEGRVLPHEIKLTGMNLAYRPAQETTPAATLVTMGIENTGGTYNRLIGKARIWGQMGGRWRKITDTEFVDTGIIPGVTLNLKEDVGRPLSKGTYKIMGVLYIDGKRSDMIEQEIQYEGDGRVRKMQTEAAMELDPREITVETLPGAVRGAPLTVFNASEDPVTIDVEVSLPDEMRHAAIVTKDGATLRGDQMSCVEWLDVSPKQFDLRGYSRRNLRVILRMPKMANPLPNYYATVRLNARYPDGSNAGTALGHIYVETQRVNTEYNIVPTGEALTLGEVSPESYYVSAKFTNSGKSHVVPRCRAVLTTMPPEGATTVQTMGMIRKRLELSGDAYELSGSMLPCETRKFSGVLDIKDLSPGLYRLTAILEYGMGGSVQTQKGIEIKEENGQKVVTVLDLNEHGGEVNIRL